VRPGIVLIILGAILTFAVRGDTNFVNLHVVGVIFLIAGSVLIYVGRKGGTRARTMTTIEDRSDPNKPVQTVTVEVTENDPFDRVDGELQGDSDLPRP
jgi:membrane protein implicated in regulation of membrane protease activity